MMSNCIQPGCAHNVGEGIFICVYREGGGIIEVISNFITECSLQCQELKFAKMEMVGFQGRHECPGTINKEMEFFSLLLIEHFPETFVLSISVKDKGKVIVWICQDGWTG